jgi:hypothetical protein
MPDEVVELPAPQLALVINELQIVYTIMYTISCITVEHEPDRHKSMPLGTSLGTFFVSSTHKSVMTAVSNKAATFFANKEIFTTFVF